MLGAGRDNDRTLPLAAHALPPGGLRLADLGFFDRTLFRAVAERGSCWRSRLQGGTAVADPEGARHDLLALRHAAPPGPLDQAIRLGATAGLPARLLAVRVPQEVADERRRRLRAAATKHGRTVSATRLALASPLVLAWSVWRRRHQATAAWHTWPRSICNCGISAASGTNQA